MQTKIVLKRSTTKIGLVIGLGLFALVCGVALLYKTMIGAISFFVISFMLLTAGAKGFLDKSARIVIDDHGLTVRAFPKRRIEWSDIRSAQLKRVPRSGDVIVLELCNGDRMQFDVTWLNLSGVEILEAIQDRIQDHGG